MDNKTKTKTDETWRVTDVPCDVDETLARAWACADAADVVADGVLDAHDNDETEPTVERANAHAAVCWTAAAETAARAAQRVNHTASDTVAVHTLAVAFRDVSVLAWLAWAACANAERHAGTDHANDVDAENATANADDARNAVRVRLLACVNTSDTDDRLHAVLTVGDAPAWCVAGPDGVWAQTTAAVVAFVKPTTPQTACACGCGCGASFMARLRWLLGCVADDASTCGVWWC